MTYSSPNSPSLLQGRYMLQNHSNQLGLLGTTNSPRLEGFDPTTFKRTTRFEPLNLFRDFNSVPKLATLSSEITYAVLYKVLNCSRLIQGFTADWPHTQLSPSLSTAFNICPIRWISVQYILHQQLRDTRAHNKNKLLVVQTMDEAT